MKKTGLILLATVFLIGLVSAVAMAQPKAPGTPTGLRITTASSCLLVIDNATDMSWEVIFFNEAIGQGIINFEKGIVLGDLEGWSRVEKEIKCPSGSFSVLLRSTNYPGIAIFRDFNLDEKMAENRFI